MLGGVVLYALLVPGSDDPPDRACNGSEALCDRPLDRVAFAATHNSMSAADQPGWRFTQQERGISAQLEAGIRGLLIDMHYGVRTSRGIQNVPLQKVRDTPATPAAGRDVYLCHTLCGFGATRAIAALQDVRDFLVERPREVVLISVQDYVLPQDVVRVFEESGLGPLAWRGPLRPDRLPTLGEMIDSDQRVLVMAENRTGFLPWVRPQFDLVQETPYRFRSPAELEAGVSCRPNRGRARNPIFLLNHWVDTSPLPQVSNAVRVNAYPFLLGRAHRCARVRDRMPNLVAVDFYEQGDLLGVVRALNAGS